MTLETLRKRFRHERREDDPIKVRHFFMDLFDEGQLVEALAPIQELDPQNLEMFRTEVVAPAHDYTSVSGFLPVVSLFLEAARLASGEHVSSEASVWEALCGELWRRVQQDDGTEVFGPFQSSPFGEVFVRLVMRLVLGAPREPGLPSAAAVFPMPARDGSGLLVQCIATALSSRGGRVILTPRQAFLAMDHAFVRTFEDAPRALIKADVFDTIEDRPDVVVRFETIPDVQQEHLYFRSLKGGSFGGALALALYGVWDVSPVESSLATSIALVPGPAETPAPETTAGLPDGRCYPVEYIEPKTRLFEEQEHQYELLVAMHQPGEQHANWIRCETLRDVIRHASVKVNALRTYLERLTDGVSRIRWSRGADAPVAVRDLAPDVRVLRVVHTEHGTGGIPGSDAEAAETPDQEHKLSVSWNDECTRLQRAFVVSGPGGGKSFLTQFTALNRAEHALRQIAAGHVNLFKLEVPLHLSLDDLAQRTAGTLAQSVAETLRQKYHFDAVLDDWLAEYLPTKPCWLLLDGLDQVRQTNEKPLKRLLDQILPEWETRVIVTCRKARQDLSALLNWPPQTKNRYELDAFNPDELQRFVNRWFDHAPQKRAQMERMLQGNPSLSQAARTPLVATLTALSIDTGVAMLGSFSRSKLYGVLLRELVRKSWSEEPIPEQDESLVPFTRLLCEVSWHLMLHNPGGDRFLQSHIEDAIAKAVTHLDSIKGPADLGLGEPGKPYESLHTAFRRAMIKRMLESTGFGVTDEGIEEPQYHFIHRTFLEYLAGLWLARNVNYNGWEHRIALNMGPQRGQTRLIDFVDAKAWSPEWKETLLFMAGMLKDGPNQVRMLKILADRKRDDLRRHRLALAVLCLPEMFPPDEWRRLVGAG